MSGRVLFGIILVLFGALFFLGQANVFDTGDLISTWWPMILIIAGIYSLVSNSSPSWGAAIVLIVGVLLQASRLDYLPNDWGKYIFPAIIIIVGLWILISKGNGIVSNDNMIKHFVVFSGIKLRNESKEFAGGSLTAIFGGIEIDLRNSKTTMDVVNLDATAMFGGVELWVPEGWRIETTGLPLFGGWEDNTRNTSLENAPTLKIRCLAAFGGIDIKN